MSVNRLSSISGLKGRLIGLAVVLCYISTYFLLALPAPANAAGEGLCVPGETRQVKGPASSASVGNYTNARRQDTRIYQPPEGWHVQDWTYVDTNSIGKNGYSIDVVQADSKFATESQLNEAYNSAIDLAGKYGLESGEASLRQARNNAVSYVRQIESSHHAVVLTVWAQGRGIFNDKGSSKAGYLQLKLRCVGVPSPLSTEAALVAHYLGGNRFYVKNNCSKATYVSLHYRNLAGAWQTEVNYHFESGEGSYLNDSNGLQVFLKEPKFYWYAESTDGSLIWAGGHQIGGLPMRELSLELDADNDYSLYLICN